MNHCHNCNSDYAAPGTCNCFAVGGKRHVAPDNTFVPYVPHVPQPTPWPWYPGTIPTGPIWWYTPSTKTGTTITYSSGTTGHFI